MKFMLVLVLSLVAVAHGHVINPVSGAVASVRQYPSFLHKCSAFFISPKTLVSTATCLLCADECEFYVAVVDTHLEDSKVRVYDVCNITLHPDVTKNLENNVAIITLEKAVPNAVIYSLPPSGMEVAGLNGFVYSWLFDKAVKEYSLKAKEMTVITNEICSYYFDEFVSDRYLCVKSNEILHFGPTDLGSPAAVGHAGKRLILGIFTSRGIIDGKLIVRYLSIFPYIKFIKSVVGDLVTDTVRSQEIGSSAASESLTNFFDSLEGTIATSEE